MPCSRWPRTDTDGVELDGYPEQCRALFAEGLAYAQDHTARRLELFLRRSLALLGCPDPPRRRARAPGRTWDPSHDATRRPEPLDLWLAAALVDLSAA